MNRRSRGLVAVGCLVALLSGACAGAGTDALSPDGASRRAGRGSSGVAGAGSQDAGAASKNGRAGGSESGGASSTEKGGSSQTSSGGAAAGGDTDPIALGSAETIDDGSDRMGPGPGYTEITRAAVEGQGDVVTFSLEVEEAFPKRLPKDSNLILGIGVQEEAEHSAVAVIAQGTAAGWTVAVQDEKGSSPIEDWSLEGGTITWTIPWERLDGPRPFEWGASLQLFDLGTDAGAASDKAPNAGPEAFPTD